MSTIISRVVEALQAHGRIELAEELKVFVEELKGSMQDLAQLHLDYQSTTKKFINVIQARCPHHEWMLVKDSTDTISCVGCGHTVCDSRAYAFGKRVLTGDFYIYSRKGRRFGLSSNIKGLIGSKFYVKEIKDGDVQERLSNSSGSTSKGEAPVVRDEPGAALVDGASNNGQPVCADGECGL